MADQTSGPAGNPATSREVVAMFDRIAPLYDLMNTVMTGGLDARWRRAAVVAARLRPGMRVLDVACGSGALTRAAAAAVGDQGWATGVDLSRRMLQRAERASRGRRPRPAYRCADALSLPFEADTHDATLIGFGLRNLPDYAAGLREMARVTRPGGRVVVLEIAAPRRVAARIAYQIWFERVIPLIGRLLGGGGAYGYLPNSLATYPEPEQVARLMGAIGLTNVSWRWLAGGMVTLHVGLKAPDR